jgi:ribbon-helix-helix CopG family protein
MYGNMYGMKRTTVHLPEELKAALTRTARATGRSEADLIREGIAQVTGNDAPRPRVPLFRGGDPHLAENVDDALKGFGED